MGLADIGTARVQAQFYESHPSEERGRYDHVGGESPPVLVGGLAERHTIAETRELIALIDFQARATDELVAKHQPVPASAVAALEGWSTWRKRWQKARDKALFDLRLLSIATPFAPESFLPSEPQYVAIKCAINKSCDESHTDPGDMREVINALEKALGASSDLSGFRAQFPERSKVLDPDLLAFQATDAAVQNLEKARAVVSPPPPIALVPWWGYVLGLVAAGGIGYSFWRVHKRAQAEKAIESLTARDPLAGIMLPPGMSLPTPVPVPLPPVT